MNCPECGVLVAIGHGDSIAEGFAGVSEDEAQDKMASHMLYNHPTPDQIDITRIWFTDLHMFARSDIADGNSEGAKRHLDDLVRITLRLKGYIEKGLL